MAHLTVNGVEIRCAAAGSQKANVYVGPSGDRSFAGTFRGEARATKREWTFTTVPMTSAESLAVQGLVEGTGQRFPLNSDTLASTGLATTTTTAESSFGSYGSHAHNPFRQLTGFTGRATWTITPASTWSLLASAVENSAVASTARSIIVTSSGTNYVDGVASASYDYVDQFAFSGSTLTWSSKIFGGSSWSATTAKALNDKLLSSNNYGFVCIQAGTTGGSTPSWPTTYGATVADGTVIWRNIGFAGASVVGELVFLPYAIPAAWAPQISTFHGSTVWGSNPGLTCGGTFSNGAEVTCLGTVTGVRFVDYMLGGVIVSGQVVEFTLREV